MMLCDYQLSNYVRLLHLIALLSVQTRCPVNLFGTLCNAVQRAEPALLVLSLTTSSTDPDSWIRSQTLLLVSLRKRLLVRSLLAIVNEASGSKSSVTTFNCSLIQLHRFIRFILVKINALLIKLFSLSNLARCKIHATFDFHKTLSFFDNF